MTHQKSLLGDEYPSTLREWYTRMVDRTVRHAAPNVCAPELEMLLSDCSDEFLEYAKSWYLDRLVDFVQPCDWGEYFGPSIGRLRVRFEKVEETLPHVLGEWAKLERRAREYVPQRSSHLQLVE